MVVLVLCENVNYHDICHASLVNNISPYEIIVMTGENDLFKSVNNIVTLSSEVHNI